MGPLAARWTRFHARCRFGRTTDRLLGDSGLAKGVGKSKDDAANLAASIAPTTDDGARGRVELIPPKRWALILERLKREGAAGIQELADAVGASASTIRRDLEYLERQGALERTHGGATLQRTELATFEPDLAIAALSLRGARKEAIWRGHGKLQN